MSLCNDGLSSDQYFLVNFIMSNYLGPDVYSDNPRYSASQRLAKGLPPYTLNHIGSSSLTIVQLQNLYCYVLRNADSSLVVQPNMVYMYLKGYLPLEPVGEYPQFTDFFPTKLHPHKKYSQSHEVVKGIVVIDDPVVAFISKEELHRFRCLSRLNDLKIDRVVSLSPRHVQLNESQGTEQECARNGEERSSGLVAATSLSLQLVQQLDKTQTEQDYATKKIEKPNELATVASLSPSWVQLDKSRGTEQDCARNGDEKSSGLVTATSLSPQHVQHLDETQVAEQDSPRNVEEETNGVLSLQHVQHLDETQGTEQDSAKKAEEKSNGMTVSPQRVQLDETREQDCARNGEAISVGLVTHHEFDSSGEIQETCERKKEEDTVAGHDVCMISKNPESQGTEEECSRNDEATSNELVSDPDCDSSAELRETCKRKKEEEEEEALAGHAACEISKTPERFRETYKRKRFKNSSTKATNKNDETAMAQEKSNHPKRFALVPFPPEMKECDTEPSVVTKGTASKGTLGQSVGVVDIGVNKVAYFFQVALPGVRKDQGEFSCEIDSDGNVILEGITTMGEKTIKRHSRVFEMNVGKPCQPGPFKLCFSLPGPVDPRLVSPNFRSDGIFEAVIIRRKSS